MTVGERIRQRRIELGMSQEALALAVGYRSRSSINKIELSRILPLKKVEQVAKALNCSPALLMGWDEEQPPKAASEPIPEDIDRGMSPAPPTFVEKLSKAEFELVDYYRHCDRWGRKGIMDTAKREHKRCLSETEQHGFKFDKYSKVIE